MFIKIRSELANSMKNMEKDKIKNKLYSRHWKEQNSEYINALEKFFDLADNIENENLRMDIIYKMLKCDEILTKLAEENWKNNV